MTICGAKTRKGTPCKKAPIKDKKRCRLHGGLSIGAKKGNQYARKHGAYAKFFSDDELAELNEMELDNLNSELKLCKIQLIRALKYQQSQLNKSDTEQLELISQTMQAVQDGETKNIERQQINKVFSKSDVDGRIDRLIGRIQSLTATIQDMQSKAIDIELKRIHLQDVLDAQNEGDDLPTVIELVAPDFGGTDDEQDQ